MIGSVVAAKEGDSAVNAAASAASDEFNLQPMNEFNLQPISKSLDLGKRPFAACQSSTAFWLNELCSQKMIFTTPTACFAAMHDEWDEDAEACLGHAKISCKSQEAPAGQVLPESGSNGSLASVIVEGASSCKPSLRLSDGHANCPIELSSMHDTETEEGYGTSFAAVRGAERSDLEEDWIPSELELQDHEEMHGIRTVPESIERSKATDAFPRDMEVEIGEPLLEESLDDELDAFMASEGFPPLQTRKASSTSVAPKVRGRGVAAHEPLVSTFDGVGCQTVRVSIEDDSRLSRAIFQLRALAAAIWKRLEASG